MPELPEVEVMKNGLKELVIGKTIKDVDVYWDDIVENMTSEEFQSALQGEQIEDVRRIGKYLIFKLTNHDLVSHMRMTGNYALKDGDFDKDDHQHVIFHLEDDSHLIYSDIRKFGRMNLLKKNEAKTFVPILKLGPEPFMDQLDFLSFTTELADYNTAVKTLLLDQSFIAGLGNIYADESLFRAQIHPSLPANYLTRGEAVKLYYAIIDIIRLGIAEGGATIRNYKNAFGEEGNFQNLMKVYGKEDEPCEVCGTKIEKIQINQRSSHFCPSCQALPEMDSQR